MVTKERLVNVGWTVGAVIIGMAVYDVFVSPMVAKFKTA